VGLQVEIRKSGDVSILDVQGKATIGRNNDLLNQFLRKAFDDGARKILVNLAGVTQVDSSGISTSARANCSAASCSLPCCNSAQASAL